MIGACREISPVNHGIGVSGEMDDLQRKEEEIGEVGSGSAVHSLVKGEAFFMQGVSGTGGLAVLLKPLERTVD